LIPGLQSRIRERFFIAKSAPTFVRAKALRQQSHGRRRWPRTAVAAAEAGQRLGGAAAKVWQEYRTAAQYLPA
jgi:hypothetical protein